MKKKLYPITFFINKNSKIVIPLQNPIEYLGPIDQENILLHNKNHNVIVADSTIYHDITNLATLLQKSLNNELLLHSSIINDIGYLYNYCHHDDTNFTMHVFPSGAICWIGYLYHIWGSLSHFDSWIYNAPDGSIIFEVTPFYPYMYCEPEEEPDYIPYEEWIKTYKPYFITTLSRETAEQWLEQAEHIIKIIEWNEKRWNLRSIIDVDS